MGRITIVVAENGVTFRLESYVDGINGYEQVIELPDDMDIHEPLDASYPIYMHCTYGMDRTGTMCYLLGALLGMSEEDIVTGLTETIGRIAEQEKRFRLGALSQNDIGIRDLVFRSYGVCRYAQIMKFGEFMRRCSDLKMGVSLGLITGITQERLNELIASGQSASLCAASGKLLNEAQENIARAQLLRKALKG